MKLNETRKRGTQSLVALAIIGVSVYLGFEPLFEFVKGGVAGGIIGASLGATFVIILTMYLLNKQTEIEQESILDSWVVWGSKWKLKYIWGYQSLPQIKQLYKDLYKEFGVLGFIKIFWKLGGVKRKVIFRAFKMKKKWPFKMPDEYLSMKISDLREEHGIKVLLPQEMGYTQLDRSK